MTTPLQLITPTMDCLPEYAAALKRGWSPDNVRGFLPGFAYQCGVLIASSIDWIEPKLSEGIINCQCAAEAYPTIHSEG